MAFKSEVYFTAINMNAYEFHFSLTLIFNLIDKILCNYSNDSLKVTQTVPVFIFKKQYKQEIFQDEKSRIEALGGVVLYMGTWRVNGNLAVSRAIGNHGNIAWENRVQTKD